MFGPISSSITHWASDEHVLLLWRGSVASTHAGDCCIHVLLVLALAHARYLVDTCLTRLIYFQF